MFIRAPETPTAVLICVLVVMTGLSFHLDGIAAAGRGPFGVLDGDSSPVWAPTGELIAFVSTRDIKSEIYTMKPDGSGVKQLTTSPLGMASSEPAWSSDGRRLAFVTGTLGATQISAMNADGSDQRVVVSGRYNTNPRWLPDGRRITFLSNRSSDSGVYVTALDGSPLTGLSSDLRHVANFSVSPDGQWVVFTSSETERGDPQFDRTDDTIRVPVRDRSKIYIADISGRQRKLLANAPGVSAVAWSPTGNPIAFVATMAEQREDVFVRTPSGSITFGPSFFEGRGQIFTVSVDGAMPRPYTAEGWNHTPVWSPDGKRIVFVSHRAGSHHIYVMNVDGSGLTQMTGLGQNGQPTWSPDSRRLAYASKRGELWRIYVQNADGTGERPITTGQ